MTLPYEPANVPTDSIGVQSLIAVTESFLRSSTPGETSPYSLSDLSIQHLNSAAHIFALTRRPWLSWNAPPAIRCPSS